MEDKKMLERISTYCNKEKDKTKKRKKVKRSAVGSSEKMLDLEKYFEDMARRGWMIEEIYAGNICVFVECEPKTVSFMIKKYAEVSITKSNAIKKNIDFLEFCQYQGWTYACTTNLVAVFYTTKENLKRVEIDYEYIKNDKSYKEGASGRIVIGLNGIIIFLRMMTLWKNHYLSIVTDYGQLYLLFICFIMFLAMITSVISYIIWRIINKKRIKNNGEIVNEKSMTYLKNIFVFLAMIGTVLCFAASFYYYGETGYSVLVYTFMISAVIVLGIIIFSEEKKIVNSVLAKILCVIMVFVVVFSSPYFTRKLSDVYKVYVTPPETVLTDSSLNELTEKAYKNCDYNYAFKVANKEVKGDFIVKYETYNIDKLNLEEENAWYYHAYSIYVYSTESDFIHDKLMDDILNNGMNEGFYHLFCGGSERCAQYEKDDGIKIYKRKDNYLIEDGKTIMCICEVQSEVDEELFDYVRELLKKY